MVTFDHEADGTGYEVVTTEVSCVITRFGLRSMWSLSRFYNWFVQIRAESRAVSGLLASIFLVENRRTCYTISVWRDAQAILEFNSTGRAHIHAANHCFQWLKVDESGPQLWSGQFRLSAVSPHNLRWEGVDTSSWFERAS